MKILERVRLDIKHQAIPLIRTDIGRCASCGTICDRRYGVCLKCSEVVEYVEGTPKYETAMDGKPEYMLLEDAIARVGGSSK